MSGRPPGVRAVTEPGGETVGETVEPELEPGLAQRGVDLVVGGARTGQPDVLGDGAGEDVRVVVDEADGAA